MQSLQCADKKLYEAFIKPLKKEKKLFLSHLANEQKCIAIARSNKA